MSARWSQREESCHIFDGEALELANGTLGTLCLGVPSFRTRVGGGEGAADASLFELFGASAVTVVFVVLFSLLGRDDPQDDGCGGAPHDSEGADVLSCVVGRALDVKEEFGVLPFSVDLEVHTVPIGFLEV